MVPPVKIYLTRGLHRSKKGKGLKIALREDPFGGERIREKKGQGGGRKLPVKGIHFPTALNALQQPYQLY